MLSGLTFGNFFSLCNEAGLPACALFEYQSPSNSDTSAYSRTLTASRNEQCSLQTFRVGDGTFRNLGDVAICAVSALLILVMIYRAHTKYAAVGRKEMNIYFSWLFFTFCLQLLTTGQFMPSLESIQIVSSMHIGFLVGSFWILMLNGFVGYQYVEDGSALSFFSILTSGIIVTVGAALVSFDVSSSIRLFNGALYNGYDSYYLFVVYFILPIVFVIIYTTLQTVLVAKNLGEQKPLINLYVALLMIIVSQILMFVLNVTICQSTGGTVDGTMFASLANLVSVIFVYRFWDSITEDDWDNVEDIFV